MNVRRYFAANMRSALEMVRQEQGPDVLILSNRKVNNGIELVTADGEIDHELMQQFTAQKKAPVNEEARADSERTAAPAPAKTLKPRPRPKSRPEPKLEVVEQPPARRRNYVREEIGHAEQSSKLWTDESTVVSMQRELNGLKGLLEQQLSSLAWSEFRGKFPVRARLLRKLSRAGIAPTLGRKLIAALPEDVSYEKGWKLTLRVLASRLKVLNDPILKNGGRIVLCGQTGVGKTLLACKLAAQFALEHGADSVALISTDDQRLGAQQQLKVFGSLLGIAVHTTRNANELAECLRRLEDKELVLVDTTGAAVTDTRLRELLAYLDAVDIPVERYLVASASTDYLSLTRTFEGTTDLDLRGCMLTKLDEAAVLGPAISAVVEAGLPVAYLTAGQQVPDDLEAPLAEQLIARTIALSSELPSPEDTMVIERAFIN